MRIRTLDKCVIFLDILCTLNVALKLVFVIVLKERLCGLVVRVPGYGTEMFCVSCEVRTEFIYVM
jgi:hypothetical protein